MGRRDFLRNLAITSGAITFGGSLLAACGGSSTTNSGVLPIGTPANPIKLPVSTDRIADGLANESGTLEILNSADKQNPEAIAIFEDKFGVKVSTSIYDSEEVAIAKLRNGTFTPDIIPGMPDTALAKLIAADLLQPLAIAPTFRSVVVLPQPDGPSIEKNSPAFISTDTSFTTTRSPSDLNQFFSVTAPPSSSCAINHRQKYYARIVSILPSTGRTCPEINRAAGELRKTAAAAMSVASIKVFIET